MTIYLNQWVTDYFGYFNALISPNVTALTHSLGAVHTRKIRCCLAGLDKIVIDQRQQAINGL